MTAKVTPAPTIPKRLSLVAQTVQSLCEGIRTGHWQTLLPGERELCEHLQVSRRTISAALAEMHREGWLEISRRRHRITNKHFTHRAGAPRKVIAVLSPWPFFEISTPLTFVMDALRDKLTKAGCAVEFHFNRACFSAHPARALAKLVDGHPPAVWLLFGSREPVQRWFSDHRLPCMVAGSCAPEIPLPSVDVDYRAACRHAGGMLWRKGHRRLALVQPQDSFGGDMDGEAGLRESLHGLPGAHLKVLRHDGTAAHLCMLLDGAMRAPHPPTAYLVVRPSYVLTVMMHLLHRGQRIPKDVAVISRDGAPFLQFTRPSTAHYATDPTVFARRVFMAVRQMAEAGALPARAIRLMPTFVPGDTV